MCGHGPGDWGELGWKSPSSGQFSCSLKVVCINLCWFVPLITSFLDPDSSQVSPVSQLSCLKFLTPPEPFISLTLQLPKPISTICYKPKFTLKIKKSLWTTMMLGKQLYLCRVEVLGSGCLQHPSSVRSQICPFKTLVTLIDQISQLEEIKPYPYPFPL